MKGGLDLSLINVIKSTVMDLPGRIFVKYNITDFDHSIPKIDLFKESNLTTIGNSIFLKERLNYDRQKESNVKIDGYRYLPYAGISAKCEIRGVLARIKKHD